MERFKDRLPVLMLAALCALTGEARAQSAAPRVRQVDNGLKVHN